MPAAWPPLFLFVIGQVLFYKTPLFLRSRYCQYFSQQKSVVILYYYV
ncbi:hypothetical protein HM1_1686 [Heliomicrobium modesticaldum Ice1]|uniref:Uncharacterized protein n=1 Tax=Heliobacterium modesticaldum (strain ATCC 51547 / Ice1) TaxID=498761 RepID=B0TE61_HELMI|nr:hypothetical protein HM1_1686 [Heliomicrobium modesticaldum Ice1]